MIASWWLRWAERRTMAAARPVPSQLSIMSLEDRTTPAGNVTAFVGDGILYVVGDAADNQVWVAGTGKRSAIVRPLGDTTLNGGTAEVRVGDIRGYHIEDPAGSNTIVVSGLNTRGTLNIRTGGGDDQVSVLDSRVRRETTVSTGAGNDDLLIADSRLLRRTAIDTGDGNDTVSVAGTTFGRDTYISGGSGVNTIGTDGVYYRGRSPHIDGFQQSFTTLFPRANADQAGVDAGAAVRIAVAANDTARAGTLDLSSIVITAPPTQGSVTANGDGTVTYTAAGSGFGTDAFRYTIRNSGGATSNEATVTVTVAGAPVSPPTVPPTVPPVSPPATESPAVTLSAAAPAVANANPIPFTARFDQDVSGMTADAIQVTNGTVVGFASTDARTYTFGVSAADQGTVTVAIPAGVATNSAGIGNTASTVVTLTYDSLAPVVTAAPLTTTNPTPTLTGTVDDPTATVSVTVGDQVVGATATGTTWTAVVPSPLTEGVYTVRVTAVDPAGNAGFATLADGLVVDLTAPTAVVSTTAPGPTNLSAIPFTVKFSEAVTGFTQAGLSVANGTAGNLAAVDGQPFTYTFDVTPEADGPVRVTVATGAATDTAGNGSVASAGAVAVSDRTPPAVTVDPAPTAAITGTAADATAAVPAVAVSVSDGTAYWGGTAFDSPTEVFLAADTTDGFATWSYPFPTAGTYTVRVRATDTPGNESITPAEVTVG